MSSFRYREYLDFYFVSSSAESTSELNAKNLKQLDSEEESYFLHMYSDLEDPVEILQVCYCNDMMSPCCLFQSTQGKNFTKDNSIAVLKRNKVLTLPRVNSCLMLDDLCAGGPSTR